MVMIKDKDGIERYSLDKTEYQVCQRIKKIINEEDDEVWGVFYGSRGCGKSLKAQRIAYCVDPTLDITRVCLDKKDFIPAVISNKKKAVIGDEGISLFHSRQVMTKDGRLISELSDQIRQNNLFVILCIPDITKLDKDILFSPNLKFVCKVWKTKRKGKNGKLNVTKGNCAYYLNLPNDNRVERIIKHEVDKKKKGKYLSSPPYHFTGKGNAINKVKQPWYPVDEKLYREKKGAILKKYMKVEEGKVEPKISNKDLVAELTLRRPDVTGNDLSKVLNISRQHVYRLIPRKVTDTEDNIVFKGDKE